MSQATLSDPELLARLVAFDSTSDRSNRPIAEFIRDYLDRPGARVEALDSPDGTKVNLVVHVGPEVDETSRAGLTLSGHLDVVPAGEPDWQSDPFTLTETDAGYVGRGACDMKGFDAIAVNLAAELAGRRLRHPLVLILTYDEEVGTIGAHHFARSWPKERPLPRATIVGEPTTLKVVRMHKGHTDLRLRLHGVAAHSGYPHLGKSAIEPAGRAIVALSELRRALEQEPCPNREHFPEVPYVALNVGTVHGGSAINVVPEYCELGIGLRVLPGMSAEPLVERLRQTLAEALGDEPFELVLDHDSPPLYTPEDDELYRHLCTLLQQHATAGVSYATDAGWFQTMGLRCLIFGPGDIAVAHKPNEIMPKDEYRRGGAIFRRLAERCCG
ncbi:MAG: acetylornithine deacetylase [Acidobacteria bacterium]|nr:MAG: acetylornithine deacetylase [Acidobacteriota bacterium]